MIDTSIANSEIQRHSPLEQDTYVGYPALERVAFSQGDPRLGTPRLMRRWYQVQHLAPLVSKQAVFDAWSASSGKRNRHRDDYRAGHGIFWEEQDGLVRIFDPEELHSRLGLEAEIEERPADELLLSAGEWNRQRVYGSIQRVQVDDEGLSDPVSSTQLAESCGLSPRTVRRHLARLKEEGKITAKRVSLVIGEFRDVAQMRTIREQYGVYVQHAGSGVNRHAPWAGKLLQPLANRYRVADPFTGEAVVETKLGALMRRGMVTYLGEDARGRQVWDGRSLVSTKTRQTAPAETRSHSGPVVATYTYMDETPPDDELRMWAAVCGGAQE